MELGAVGVGLTADLGPARAARVVVLVAVRQDQEELLPNRVSLLAAGAEQTRRLKLAETVYHVRILDHNHVGWAARARRPGGFTLRAQRIKPSDGLKVEKKSDQTP